MSQKQIKYTSSKGKEVLWIQNEEFCKRHGDELTHAKPTDKYIQFDVSEKVLKKKCKGCGHSIRSHYCEITVGSSDFRGHNKTYSKTQHCISCNFENCHARSNDLDIAKPILKFWAWDKKK